MSVKGVLFFILLAVQLVFPAPAQAQDSGPVVHVVFFYLPTCPHCHDVINNVFPAWYEEFGSRLEIIAINGYDEGASELFRSACAAYNVPSGRCGSVPTMIIGSTVLIGARDIPDFGTPMIREALANDGLPVPNFPGMAAYYETFSAAQQTATGDESPQQTTPIIAQERSLFDRFRDDTLANTAAVIVLAGLMSSAGWMAFHLWRARRIDTRHAPAAVIAVLVAGLFIGLSLVSQGGDDSRANAAAWLVLALVGVAAMLAALAAAARPGKFAPSRWIFPMIAVAGLCVAAYLAYVETQEIEAVCGAVGNCNAVQQSEYARILGIPVGVLGIAGYVVILTLWGMSRLFAVRHADKALFAAVVLGVVFSIYLTFLEPFVIGATCAWCLMSAVTMLALLWLAIPEELSTRPGIRHVTHRKPRRA